MPISFSSTLGVHTILVFQCGLVFDWSLVQDVTLNKIQLPLDPEWR